MTASWDLVELVRKAISNKYLTASDTAVAKALGLSRTAVSAYKRGRDHMSADTVAHACEIAGIWPQSFYWTTKIAAERETGEAQRQAREMLADLELMKHGKPPEKGGIVEMLINWKSTAAGLIPAAILAALALQPDAAKAGNTEVSAQSGASGEFAESVYYDKHE